jgi:hypothetical protein
VPRKNSGAPIIKYFRTSAEAISNRTADLKLTNKEKQELGKEEEAEGPSEE